MTTLPLLETELLTDLDVVRDWAGRFENRLLTSDDAVTAVQVQVEQPDDNGFEMALQAVVHGVELRRTLGPEFFRSAEYQTLVKLSHHLNDGLEPVP